jgi:hypothetical protein
MQIIPIVIWNGVNVNEIAYKNENFLPELQ